jgi:ribonucleoside-diphosphate reductase alpha chain
VLSVKKEEAKAKVNGTTTPIAEEKKVVVDGPKNPLAALWNKPKIRPRPKLARGVTIKKDSPLGAVYITINNDDEGEPLEIFITAGKAGSDVTSMADAMGRLASILLRIASPVTPHERLQEIVTQLKGIGGARSTGFGPNRVRSLPDAVAQAVEECCTLADGVVQETELPDGHVQVQLPLPSVRADLCPQCGEASFVHEEGCMHCNACGFSQC